MNPADPDHALRTSPAFPPSAAAPGVVWVPAPRTRVAVALVIVACLLVIVGAVLPWLTTVDVNPQLGAVTRRLTWHVWSTNWVVYFPLLAIPLVALVRTGLVALRGRPFRRTRRTAVQLSLVGLVGTLIFGALTAFDAGMSGGFFGRGLSTDVLIEGGLPVSLGSWVLALIASVLLPAKSGR
jgi:hypothetical protein